jgi:flagellar basal-body rod protein FlgG
MIRALHTAATGMDAQQQRIDVIANNLANVNTTGFKKSRVDFQDLLYQQVRAPGTASAQGVAVPSGTQIGTGVRTAATHRTHTTGDIVQTGNQLDVAIEGDGFFQVTMPDGSTAFTRAGNFELDQQGQIVTPDGYPIEPAIAVPPGTTSVTIGSDGTVSAVLPGETEASEVGQMQLANFVNPGGLMTIGRNFLKPTTASGEALIGPPGIDGAGRLSQGFLEMSNVKVVEEMVGLISSQRAYEVSSKVIQASDEMLQAATNAG